MRKRKIFKSILISLLIMVGSAAVTGATLTEDLFKRGVGVRSMGMGGAATAVGGDASAIFYNPAGLSDLIFEYASGGTDADRLDYTASRFDLLSVGPFAYSSYGLSTSTESASTVMYGFGNKSGGGFNWGLTYKTARWNVATGTSEGWSADLGILLKVTPSFSIGILGQEIASQRGFVAPSSTRVGISLMPLMDRMIFACDVELDEGRRNDNLTHLGMELEIAQGFKARVGSDQGEVTAGATLQLPLIALDYAMKNRGGNQGLLQSFGGSVRLVKKRERTLSLFGPKEYAVIDVRGTVIGGGDRFSLLGGYQAGLETILSNLRQAARDKGVSGILIRLSGFSGGLGSTAIAQEIREEIIEAKRRGKKVVVYIESSALGEGTYIASAADKVIAPQGVVLGGLAKKIAITRIKDLYGKIGIEWQIFTQGKNKDTFSGLKDGLTEEQKDILQGVITDLYRQMIKGIADDREIDIARLKEVADGQILSVKEAQNLGLVDTIGYFDEATKVAGKLVGAKQDIKLIKPKDLMPEKDMQDYLFSYFNKIAVIDVDGEIVVGGGGENLLFGNRYIGADTVTENIRKAVEDNQVKAILIRINSPGGSAIAAGQIYEEILKAREKNKTVVASIGNVGASGGYYIACAADYIVASPGTITGSIGVIGAIPAMRELYEKIGVKREVVKEGKYADMFAGIDKLTPEEKKSIRKLQKDTYDEFVKKVIAGRKLPTAEVKAIADGRILTGNQAVALGLVDELGGIEKAIEVAKEEGDIRGEPILVRFGKKQGFWVGFSTSLIKMLGLEDGLLPAIDKTEINEMKLY